MAAVIGYRQRIEALAPGYDARHIEAFMRLEHPTLDGLPEAIFAREVEIGRLAVDQAGTDFAERAARSFGL